MRVQYSKAVSQNFPVCVRRRRVNRSPQPNDAAPSVQKHNGEKRKRPRLSERKPSVVQQYDESKERSLPGKRVSANSAGDRLSLSTICSSQDIMCFESSPGGAFSGKSVLTGIESAKCKKQCDQGTLSDDNASDTTNNSHSSVAVECPLVQRLLQPKSCCKYLIQFET